MSYPLVRHKFFGFWKISSFGSKRKWVSLWFYRKHLFMTKTCQKFIFHHHESHILAQFDITLLYTIFQFWKISSFSSKHKGVILQFYRKTSICDKNWSKIQISSPWGLYSCSIRHYSVVHIFFEILKNIEFRFITQMGYPSILPKNICSRWKHVENSYFILVWSYSCSIRHYCDVHNFLEVLKNIEFQLKAQRVPFGLTDKRLSTVKTGQKICVSSLSDPYYVSVTPFGVLHKF
jgi:hypothetical protein